MKNNSFAINDYLGFNGNPVFYSKVTEFIMDVSNNLNNGKTVYTYTNEDDSPLYFNKPFTVFNDNSWRRGLVKKIESFKSGETTPCKTITSQYNFLSTKPFNLAESGLDFTAPSQPDEYHRMSYEFFVKTPEYTLSCGYGIITNVANFDYIGKKLVSAHAFKTSEEVIENINNASIKTTTNYTYNTTNNFQ